jgi:hypothetical protein
MTELARELTNQARLAAGAINGNGAVKRDVLAAALGAARAWRGSPRGWALVHLAGALRDHSEPRDALAFLDIADAESADPDVIRAAFTCAIAIHCDEEAFELANTLCDEQRSRMPADERFLRAEIRARRCWLNETGEQAALEALERAESELQLLAGPVVFTQQGSAAPSSS